VTLLTRYGDDADGRLLAEHLTGNGVELASDPVDARPTSTAVARLKPDGSADYEFDLHWELPGGSAAPAGSPVAVHTGSIAATLEPGAGAVERVVARLRGGATVSYDPNCRPALMGSAAGTAARVERWVGGADLVKVSTEDLEWLYPDRDWRDTARAWFATGPAIVIVTAGGDGSWAVTAGGELAVPARPVSVVDTVGAGDSFTAGLLSALYNRALLGADARAALRAISLDTVRAVLEHASLVSALTVQRAGADSPRSDELTGLRS
jgi:fructokinase